MIIKLRKATKRNVQYLDRNGKWKSTGCSTKEEAKAWYIRNFMGEFPYFKDFAKGFFTERGKNSFHQLCMMTKRYQNEEWWDSNARRMELYILPMFGDLMWDDITTPLIQDWYLGLEGRNGKEIADATKKKIFNCLNTVMKQAVFRGVINSNPCESVVKIVEQNRERKPFTRDELARMFPPDVDDLCDIWSTLQMACFFLISRDTGWRPGQIAGLTFENYHPERLGIFTRQSIDFKNRKVKQRVKTSDSGYAFRVGKISEQTRFVMDLYISSIPETERTGLLFTSGKGLPITLRWIEKCFKNGLARLGISDEDRPPYALRTTFFTLSASEMPEDVLMELMGHKKWHFCYDKRTPEDMIDNINRKLKA